MGEVILDHDLAGIEGDFIKPIIFGDRLVTFFKLRKVWKRAHIRFFPEKDTLGIVAGLQPYADTLSDLFGEYGKGILRRDKEGGSEQNCPGQKEKGAKNGEKEPAPGSFHSSPPSR